MPGWEDPTRAINQVIQIADTDRVAALRSLALGASASAVGTRRLALSTLPRVARDFEDLLCFLTFVQAQRGWGRALKTSVQDWLNSLSPEALAREFVQTRRYRNFVGKSGQHWWPQDLLRLAHPKTKDPQRNAVYKWALGKGLSEEDISVLPDVILAYEEAQGLEDNPEGLKRLCELVAAHRMTREMVPEWSLRYLETWGVLAKGKTQ